MISALARMPGSSRVWVYQSNRLLLDAEVRTLTEKLHFFVNQWTSHSRQVRAAGDVLHNLFIVLAADESAFPVSGCAIDTSVAFMRQLEQEYNIRLFDRHTVAYRDQDTIKLAPPDAFQQLIDQGKVHADTPVFNNLVSTLQELRNSWEVPLSSSWHKKLFSLPA
ncbi:MAG: hypothetical protein KatS3mg031_1938 [Chitinophagales bacterium]|nr:MAG: hypothetical protein KatS3mg031_1938 [Chitinophagales bacterium]